MKTKILTELKNSKDYVSGQQLCEKFGVSRTAVWKAVEQLRESGYGIESVRRKGYLLVSRPEQISVEEIQSGLNTRWLPGKICYFDTIDSTNRYADQLGREGKVEKDGILVVADHQTMGKGRRGRTWVSPAGKNIFMSLLLKPGISVENVSGITLVMALSISRAMQMLYGLPVQIKWPNDIVCRGKKLCGILTEMRVEENEISHVVIGVGINVNIEEFPEEIKDTATSLYLELQQQQSRSRLICEIMKQFEQDVERFYRTENLSELQEEYQTYLVNQNQEICVIEPDKSYRGIGRGINEKGELLVELPDGTMKKIYAGEVSVRGVYGYV